MPHRVTNFFRLSTSALESQVSNLTKPKKKGTSSSQGRRSSEREDIQLSMGYSSEGDDEASSHSTRRSKVTGSESATSSSIFSSSDSHHSHGHRSLFPSIHFGRSSKESHTNSSVNLICKIESPPVVLYGDAEHSTGALISGLLCLDIKEDDTNLDSLTAALSINVTQKRPFANHCSDCATQVKQLKKWDLVENPLVLKKAGEHSWPFSFLLEGHLPASMDTPLVVVSYELKAEAITSVAGLPQTPIQIKKTLDVKRSLGSSELPHHSVRVFPPTNIKASAHYPHIIHPIGSYNLNLKLDGISRHNTNVDTIEYWKLKKLTWRLEETTKTVAPACTKHSPKLEGADGQPKGVARTETKVIGEKTLFAGWKANYMSTTDSSIELELDYNLAKHAKYTCDTKCRDGTEVSHQLMVEMVVSQEWAPVNKPALVTHTGVGRILRMHFGTILTERAGIGISWDNEAPPIYQDVPPSPPAYFHDETFLEGVSSIDELMEPLESMASGSSVRESTHSHDSNSTRESWDDAPPAFS